MSVLVAASRVAKHVRGELVGPDRNLVGVRAIDDVGRDYLSFAVDVSALTQAMLMCEAVILVSSVPAGQHRASFILVSNPRLAFANALHLMYPEDESSGVHPTALVAPSVQLGDDISIGPFCVIEAECDLADGVRIEAGSVIKRKTVIGRNVAIGSNCTIGSVGYGFEPDELGIPRRVPHIGRVVIGEAVEIGSNVVIARGTVGSTEISANCKIDDHVFIAHNVKIGFRSQIVAGVEISGSVRIGDDCWIAPQASIRQKLTIGDRAVVGIGAVVVKDVPAGTTVVGNPARLLTKPV